MMRWVALLLTFTCLYTAYVWRDTFNPDDIRGKRVVITGASAGIGEQMAYHYARLGASILITARREHVLKQVIERCREVGRPDGQYFYIGADMQDGEATKRIIQAAAEKLGGIDYLVLNHIMQLPIAEWQANDTNFALLHKVMNINFKAYVYLASYALPLLEKAKGSIVVMSSLAGKISQPYLNVYSASKFALDGFFSGLRQELKMKESNVSVTLCVIGLIGTDSTVSNLKRHGYSFMLETVKAAEPADAAMAVIKGGNLRLREMYFPYMETKILTLLRDWMPGTVDAINRYMYRKDVQ